MRIIFKKNILILIISGLLLCGCAEKKEDKIYRVGILPANDFFYPTIDAFKKKMTELGYIEGKNIIYDVQRTHFKSKVEKAVLDKWIAEKIDLMVVTPTEVAISAKKATKDTGIPVLFANVYIEGFDLVNDVTHPGGNLTGVRYFHPDIAVKGLETLLEIAPEAKRIWLPYMDGYPSVPSQLEKVQKAAAAFGVKIIEFPAKNIEDIESELDRKSENDDPGMDAVMHVTDPVGTWSRVNEAIGKFVIKHRLPYYGMQEKCVVTLTINQSEVGRLAAPMADKILRGISPGSIPVVSVDPLLTVNYKMAQELGIKIPESMLARAEKIIR